MKLTAAIMGVNDMQIESGKYYRTRDGRKVGPIGKLNDDIYQYFSGEDTYTSEGKSFVGRKRKSDLISEWTDEPEPATLDLAALAAQHRIKITVQVGEVLIEYDGRV